MEKNNLLLCCLQIYSSCSQILKRGPLFDRNDVGFVIVRASSTWYKSCIVMSMITFVISQIQRETSREQLFFVDFKGFS